VHRRWGDFEISLQVCFRRYIAMDLGIVVDESQVLALKRCIGRFSNGSDRV